VDGTPQGLEHADAFDLRAFVEESEHGFNELMELLERLDSDRYRDLLNSDPPATDRNIKLKRRRPVH
jgi:hypothetical protein